MKGKSIWLAVALLGLILPGPATDSWAAETEEIGMMHFESAALDGSLLASGKVVLNREIVRTEMRLAVVHLDNGQVLRFEANSSARFEEVSFDEIEVTVFSGRVTKWGVKGRRLTAGAGSRFTLGRTLQDPMAAERALLRVAPTPSGDDDESSDHRMGR
jgi:hypothetical protein